MKISEVEYPQRTRNVAVSEEQFFQSLPSIQLALEAAVSGICRIYRGESSISPGVKFVEPAKYTRRSANTDNYYTELVDNSDRWTMYPKRSQSLICTNHLQTASGYGDIHVVLPQADPVIGVCSGIDFWYSFHHLQDVTQGGPSELNSTIKYIYYTLTHNELGSSPSYPELVDAFRAIDQKNPYWPVRSAGDTTVQHLGDSLFQGAQAWKDPAANRLLKLGGNLLRTCDQLLDPAKNNFSARHLSEMKLTAEHELWLSAPSFLVPVDKFRYWRESGRFPG
jgi:hypothetical protein